MRLLDFFIRISLQGGRAARDLAQIMASANRTRQGLNATGSAATQTGRRLNAMGRQAARANSSLRNLFRTSRMRFGAGGSIGGVAFGGSGTALAVGAGAAGAGTLTRMRRLENARAELPMALGITDVAESNRLQEQLIAAQRRGVKLMVDGINVLSNVPMVDIAEAQVGLLKAGVTAAEVIDGSATAAFVTLQRLSKGEASTDDITTAIAKAKALSDAMGASRQDAAAILASIGGSTEFGLADVIKGLPRTSGILKELGGTLQDYGQIMILTAEQFGTGVLNANAMNQALKAMVTGPTNKFAKQTDEKFGIDYTDNGRFKGWRYMRDTYLRLERDLGVEGAQMYAVKRFGAHGMKLMLALKNKTDAELLDAEKRSSAATGVAANQTLKKQYEAFDGAVEQLKTSWDKFADSMVQAGILTALGDILRTLATALVWLSDTVAANPAAFKTFFDVLLWGLGILVTLRTLFTTWRVGSFLAGFLRLRTVFALLINGARYLVLAIAAVLGAPAWAVAALAALLAIVVYYWDSIWATIKSVGSDIWSFLGDVWKSVASAGSVAWDTLKSAGAAAWEAIKAAAWNAVVSMFGWLSTLGSAFTGAWNNLKSLVGAGSAVTGAQALTLGTGGMGLAGLGGVTNYYDNRQVHGASSHEVTRLSTQVANKVQARQVRRVEGKR